MYCNYTGFDIMVVGKQILPAQDISPWHITNSKLVIFKKLQTQEELKKTEKLPFCKRYFHI